MLLFTLRTLFAFMFHSFTFWCSVRVRTHTHLCVCVCTAALHPPASRALFQFQDELDIARFQVTTDTVLGGNTTCVFMLEECGPDGGPVGVFQGLVQPPDYDGRVNKGGFASFRTKPFEKSWNLDVFKALQLTVRTDGRPCVVCGHPLVVSPLSGCSRVNLVPSGTL